MIQESQPDAQVASGGYEICRDAKVVALAATRPRSLARPVWVCPARTLGSSGRSSLRVLEYNPDPVTP